MILKGVGHDQPSLAKTITWQGAGEHGFYVGTTAEHGNRAVTSVEVSQTTSKGHPGELRVPEEAEGCLSNQGQLSGANETAWLSNLKDWTLICTT